MKILLSAYACLPGEGSDDAIGWFWAQCIANKGHLVTVITRGLRREKIDSYTALHPMPSIRFIYHEPRFLGFLDGLPLVDYFAYAMWQWTAAALARKLHSADPFDQVQHITWSSFRVPSFMGSLGIPFIFGPVGGGEDTPRKLRKGVGLRGRLWDALRRLSSRLAQPAMSDTYASASLIVLTTEETRACIPARFRSKTMVQQAVGAELPPPGVLANNGSSSPCGKRLELMFAGRLLAWKGPHLLLQALAQVGLDETQIHLTIVGSGPDGKRLRKLSKRLGIDSKITWIPWIERDRVLQMYAEFDLFTFPSLHDSGGVAVLEALSYGLPVLCLDLGGPAAFVDETCGYVISTADAAESDVVAAISRTFEAIAADRSPLQLLSRGAVAKVSRHGWQAMVDAVYDLP